MRHLIPPYLPIRKGRAPVTPLKGCDIYAISAARSKIRNKQRGCTDPAERAVLKRSCAACTAELSRLRKQKQTAYNMIEDNPKLKTLLACEVDAWVENDPYLSPREKRALRNQRPPQEEKTIIR